MSSRIRLIIVAMLIVPVLLYWGFTDSTSLTESRPPALFEQGYDFFLTGVTTRAYNKEGQIQQSIVAERIEHRSEEKISVFYQPRFLLSPNQNNSIRISADKAYVDDQLSHSTLTGEVTLIDRKNQLTLFTDNLVIYPEEQRAETALDVTLLTNNGKFTATGMLADYGKGQMALQKQVKGVVNND